MVRALQPLLPTAQDIGAPAPRTLTAHRRISADAGASRVELPAPGQVLALRRLPLLQESARPSARADAPATAPARPALVGSVARRSTVGPGIAPAAGSIAAPLIAGRPAVAATVGPARYAAASPAGAVTAIPEFTQPAGAGASSGSGTVQRAIAGPLGAAPHRPHRPPPVPRPAGLAVPTPRVAPPRGAGRAVVPSDGTVRRATSVGPGSSAETPPNPDGVATVTKVGEHVGSSAPVVRRAGDLDMSAAPSAPSVSASVSNAENDSRESTPTSLSRNQVNQLVDEVVDRIERRVLDELERRGRRHVPGVF